MNEEDREGKWVRDLCASPQKKKVRCRGTNFVLVNMYGMLLGVQAIVADNVIVRVDIMMGMDIIKWLGAFIVSEGGVIFGGALCAECEATKRGLYDHGGESRCGE